MGVRMGWIVQYSYDMVLGGHRTGPGCILVCNGQGALSRRDEG